MDIRPDYGYKGVRSYRVSTDKIERVTGFKPTITVEESVQYIIENINKFGYTDFDNPRYYNIRWMKLLEEIVTTIHLKDSIFEAPKKSADIRLLQAYKQVNT